MHAHLARLRRKPDRLEPFALAVPPRDFRPRVAPGARPHRVGARPPRRRAVGREGRTARGTIRDWDSVVGAAGVEPRRRARPREEGGTSRAPQAAGVADQAVPPSAPAARVSGGAAGAAVGGRSKGPRRRHCPMPRSNDPRHRRAQAPEPCAPDSLYDSALPPLPSPPTEAAASCPRSPSANHRRCP